MKFLLSSIKAAALLLAFAALTPCLHAVSETYIPSNAKFALYVNASKAVNSPALKTLLSKDGVDLAKSLDDVAMILDDLTGDVSFFLTEIDPADFEKSLMDVVLYAPGRVDAIYKRLAGRDDIKTEASTVSGVRILKIHTKNGSTDALAFVIDNVLYRTFKPRFLYSDEDNVVVDGPFDEPAALNLEANAIRNFMYFSQQ